jgi:hypothetical protein
MSAMCHWLVVLMLAWAAPVRAELLILTRDGELHHGVDGPHAKIPVEKPRAMTVAHESPLVLAVAHEKGLHEVAGKHHAVPGKQDDLVQVASAGGKLYGLTHEHELVEIDDGSGKRTSVAKWPHGGFLAGDGDALIQVHEGKVEQLGAGSWKLTGTPVAVAACNGRVFVATKEGPLWQLDRASGRQRDLGMGSWWGTLALACEGTHVYAATQAGKLWDIDIASSPTKTALAMDGWQGTVALAVTK